MFKGFLKPESSNKREMQINQRKKCMKSGQMAAESIENGNRKAKWKRS